MAENSHPIIAGFRFDPSQNRYFPCNDEFSRVLSPSLLSASQNSNSFGKLFFLDRSTARCDTLEYYMQEWKSSITIEGGISCMASNGDDFVLICSKTGNLSVFNSSFEFGPHWRTILTSSDHFANLCAWHSSVLCCGSMIFNAKNKAISNVRLFTNADCMCWFDRQSIMSSQANRFSLFDVNSHENQFNLKLTMAQFITALAPSDENTCIYGCRSGKLGLIDFRSSSSIPIYSHSHFIDRLVRSYNDIFALDSGGNLLCIDVRTSKLKFHLKGDGVLQLVKRNMLLVSESTLLLSNNQLIDTMHGQVIKYFNSTGQLLAECDYATVCPLLNNEGGTGTNIYGYNNTVQHEGLVSQLCHKQSEIERV